MLKTVYLVARLVAMAMLVHHANRGDVAHTIMYVAMCHWLRENMEGKE